MPVISKIFEPVIDIWEYTFLSVFLTIALITWEFTRGKNTIGFIKTKGSKPQIKPKINHNITEELKNTVIDTEVLRNRYNESTVKTEDDIEEVKEEVIPNESPFHEIISILDQNDEMTAKPFRDTEQIIVSDSSESGYFVKGDLPDEFQNDEFWESDAIEIIDDEVLSNEQITEILAKLRTNIPLDEQEIQFYEKYLVQEKSQKLEDTENIFADY